MELLTVRDLVKEYRNGDGVHGLTFAVKRGEVVALLGPNGAGKTTTIRCIAGMFRPDRGEILIGGHRAGTAAALEQVALIPDQPHLYPMLTVAEHLQFRARSIKVGKQELRNRVIQALAEVNMEALADRESGQLSKGQKQRVILAGAVLQEASVYLMDEPTVGLDIPSKKWLAEWIRRKAKEQAAVLVSTHSLEFVMETAQRVLLIRDGTLMTEMKVPLASDERQSWKDEVIRKLGEWSDG